MIKVLPINISINFNDYVKENLEPKKQEISYSNSCNSLWNYCGFYIAHVSNYVAESDNFTCLGIRLGLLE